MPTTLNIANSVGFAYRGCRFISDAFSTKWKYQDDEPQIPLSLIILQITTTSSAGQMLGDQTQILPFKCSFCGFLYEAMEEAEECELQCVSRALDRMDEKTNRSFAHA